MNALHPERNEVHETRVDSRRRRLVSATLHANATGMALCLCLALLGTGCVKQQTTRADNVTPESSPMLDVAYSKDANVAFVAGSGTATAYGAGQVAFNSESASRRTRDMADWVVRSGDNAGMPFAIIDKVNARSMHSAPAESFTEQPPCCLEWRKAIPPLPELVTSRCHRFRPRSVRHRQVVLFRKSAAITRGRKYSGLTMISPSPCILSLMFPGNAVRNAWPP